MDHKAHHGDDGHTTASTMGQHYGPALRASTTGQHNGPARRACTAGEHHRPARPQRRLFMVAGPSSRYKRLLRPVLHAVRTV